MHRTVFVCLLAAAYSEECHSDESDLIQKQVRTKALDWRWDLPKAREVPLDLLQAGRSGESLTTTPAPGPNPAGPPALCHGHDCDYWAVSGYSCEMLHDYYQCDCSGSKCTLDLPTCQKTCNGHSCDYWAGLYNMQCHAEPLDQCDCSGCLCMNDVKVNTSAVPPSPTPNASTTGSPSTGEVCEICGTEPCDYWVQNGIFNCDQLAGYECTCKGCSVCQASNSSNSSNSSNGTVHHDDSGSSCALCGIKTCDDWVHNEEYSCDQLLNEYRCSCQGCSVCQAPPTVGSHSPVANVTSNATQDECESCAGQTCEYWVNAGHYDCAYLKNYGCTCRGCSVCKENYHGGTTAAPTEEETTEPETDEDETSEPETDEGGTTGAPTEEETTEPEMDEDETSEPETDEGGTTAAPTEEETTEPETDEGGTTAAPTEEETTEPEADEDGSTAAPTEGGSTAAPTEATTSVEANTTEVCEMCGSKSCDDWIRTGLYDCHYLQDISACGCKGCGLCKAKNGTTPAPTGPTPRPTEATTTPKGSPTTGPQECEKCGAESCDFWIHQKLYDCAYLKNYGCSCAGCQECQDTTGSEAPQPTTAPQVTRKPDEECEQCNGASCDYWVTQGVADCAELHSLGCTCSGCSSCQATTAPQQPETDVTTTKQEACPQCTSLGMTCDEAAEQHGYSCKYVTAAGWGCDCSTCNCPLDKEVCPKNCGGDHDCDFWMAQKQGWTCDELESTYGCVCNGCSSCASA